MKTAKVSETSYSKPRMKISQDLDKNKQMKKQVVAFTHELMHIQLSSPTFTHALMDFNITEDLVSWGASNKMLVKIT